MIKFGLFTDMQYADLDDRNGRNYRGSLDRFLQAAGDFNARKLPLVLQLGDAMDRYWSNLTTVSELFEKTKLHLASVPGNHDFILDDDQKKKVFSLLKIPKPGYYSFHPRQEPGSSGSDPAWRFIVLHGMDISVPAACNDAEREEARKYQEKYRLANGKLPADWNGYMTPRQLTWLDQQLSDADKKHENVLLCSHFPLYARGNSVRDSFRLTDNIGGALGNMIDRYPIYYSLMGVSVWNGADLLDIMDRHSCVKAYFAGHLHEGSYGCRKGVHHVTFRGMVETLPNAYAFITLSGNKIIIEGAGKEESRELVLPS